MGLRVVWRVPQLLVYPNYRDNPLHIHHHIDNDNNNDDDNNNNDDDDDNNNNNNNNDDDDDDDDNNPERFEPECRRSRGRSPP